MATNLPPELMQVQQQNLIKQLKQRKKTYEFAPINRLFKPVFNTQKRNFRLLDQDNRLLKISDSLLNFEENSIVFEELQLNYIQNEVKFVDRTILQSPQLTGPIFTPIRNFMSPKCRQDLSWDTPSQYFEDEPALMSLIGKGGE
ncbi:hypothetical protein SS50377_21501 [Spironucleus salmonicida]|uniref:Uncharacterized protein n=1 Tax=Spironucleus salmonicida TaxID=348837 RepID=V6LXD1_9EUKA|nr:hypothetical protein SS50377_21501 [Spironucleus salmonicida]|eukprot:EST45479.1 Hypothetical protein SS50377_14548 [Spironucleus salmonicida]